MRLVYNLMSKFESEQFMNLVFSILNVNSKRRIKKISLLTLGWTDIPLDLNSKNVEKEKKRHKRLVKKLVEGLKQI